MLFAQKNEKYFSTIRYIKSYYNSQIIDIDKLLQFYRIDAKIYRNRVRSKKKKVIYFFTSWNLMRIVHS